MAVVDRVPAPRVDTAVTVLTQDLNDPPRFEVGPYDYIMLLDVIEHLRDPESFMSELRKQFDYTPRTLILTTPNVAFIVQRLMLLLGQFNYGRAGILDRTHTRLFTFRSLNRLLRDAGLRTREVRGVPAPFPKVFGDGWVGKGLLAANEAPDPRQQDAVLVPDLRRGRDHARGRVRLARHAGAQRRAGGGTPGRSTARRRGGDYVEERRPDAGCAPLARDAPERLAAARPKVAERVGQYGIPGKLSSTWNTPTWLLEPRPEMNSVLRSAPPNARLVTL